MVSSELNVNRNGNELVGLEASLSPGGAAVVHKLTDKVKAIEPTKKREIASKLSTLAAAIITLSGWMPESPKGWVMSSPIVSLLLLRATEGIHKQYEEEKELRSHERACRKERLKLRNEAKHLPHKAPSLIQVGQDALTIANILNEPGVLEVTALGQYDGLTYTRYYFAVSNQAQRSHVFSQREEIKEALNSTTDVTFQWSEGRLCVDVQKPKELCRYPKVREHLGSDRQQLLLPIGLKGEELLTTEDKSGWVVGRPRAGRSEWARGCAQFLGGRHTHNLVQYAFCEPTEKAATFTEEEWGRDPHLFAPIAHSAAVTLQIMAKAIYEARRRAPIFEKAGCKKIEDYNEIADKPVPHIFLFLDEPEYLMDPLVCDELTIKAFLRMALIIARVLPAAGIHQILLPKRVAAGERDIFPPQLRSALGGLKLCLAAQTVQDGWIALQAQEEEFLASSAPHLPGRGAGIYRDGGSLVRIQTLYADGLAESIVKNWGKPNNQMSDLPKLSEVLLEFCNEGAAEDGELSRILASEGTSLAEIEAELKRLASGKPSNVTTSEPDNRINGIDITNPYQLYNVYRTLRELQGKSMTESWKQMSGRSENSVEHQALVEACNAAIIKYLPDWVEDLDQSMTDEQMMRVVWGDRRGDNKKQALAAIRQARSYLKQQKAVCN